jgi:hypothetical protein
VDEASSFVLGDNIRLADGQLPEAEKPNEAIKRGRIRRGKQLWNNSADCF